MTYFKINNIDFSRYVNKLKIAKDNVYRTEANAKGKTMAIFINTNYIVEVGIIPLDAEAMQNLQTVLKAKDNGVSISFLDDETGELKTIDCILTKQAVDYYTIQDSNIRFNAFTLAFSEAIITRGA